MRHKSSPDSNEDSKIQVQYLVYIWSCSKRDARTATGMQ